MLVKIWYPSDIAYVCGKYWLHIVLIQYDDYLKYFIHEMSQDVDTVRDRKDREQERNRSKIKQNDL